MDKKRASILVVDDESSIRESFKLILSEKYDFFMATSGETAVKKVADQKIDLIFLDIRMPGMNGLETLKHLKKITPSTQIIMVTAVNDVEKASEAINLGANDYIVKPFDVQHILNLTARLLQRKYLAEEARAAWKQASQMPCELLGSSTKIKAIKETIEKIADKDFFVLIEGAIGSEKEAVARCIHEKSPRAKKNFAVINIPKNANANRLEEELYGVGSGKTVSSMELSEGLLEYCQDGTLLINNIENLPKEIQEKLCQTIKEKIFKRKGSQTIIDLKVRIIATCMSSLKGLVDSEHFNLDLYSLISESNVKLAPLSERSIDIPLLLNYYLNLFNLVYQKDIRNFTEDALNVLSTYSWPGNIEEFKSIVEIIVMTKEKEFIEVADLPFGILLNSSAYQSCDESTRLHYDKMEESFEKEMIKELLNTNSHDKAKVSKLLQLSPNAFKAKLESLEI